jgi:hypothetical protein
MYINTQTKSNAEIYPSWSFQCKHNGRPECLDEKITVCRWQGKFSEPQLVRKVCVCVCFLVCVCLWVVYVCVCEREREIERRRETLCGCLRVFQFAFCLSVCLRVWICISAPMLVYMCACLYLLVCSHVDTYVYMCVWMLSHIRKNVGIPMSRIEQRPKMTFFDARTQRIHSLCLYFYLSLSLSLSCSLSWISTSCLIFALVYVIKCSLSLLNSPS